MRYLIHGLYTKAILTDVDNDPNATWEQMNIKHKWTIRGTSIFNIDHCCGYSTALRGECDYVAFVVWQEWPNHCIVLRQKLCNTIFKCQACTKNLTDRQAIKTAVTDQPSWSRDMISIYTSKPWGLDQQLQLTVDKQPRCLLSSSFLSGCYPREVVPCIIEWSGHWLTKLKPLCLMKKRPHTIWYSLSDPHYQVWLSHLYKECSAPC